MANNLKANIDIYQDWSFRFVRRGGHFNIMFRFDDLTFLKNKFLT
jgi:hypothetical protein